MQIKLIIFGLEGVLCHLEKYHRRAWKQIADELEIPFLEEQEIELLGLSRMDSLKRILKNYPGVISKAEREILAEDAEHFYQEYLLQVTASDCDAEADAVLNRLLEKGYLLAVVSTEKNAKKVLKLLGLEHYFAAVIGGSGVRADPRKYLQACESVDQPPENCLVVERNENAARAALEAGVQVIVCGGKGKKLPGAETIGNLSELLGCLDEGYGD